MAIKTYVTGSSTATIADNDVTVVGGTAGAEKVKILTGVTGVTADANIEKFDLAGSLADYKFVFVAGTGVQIQTAAGVVVTTIPSLNQAATLAFADGSAALTQSGSSAFALGSAAIPTTAAVLTTAAIATFDTTVKSTVNPNVAAGVGQVFTLTTSATSDSLVLSTGNDTVTGGAGALNATGTNDLIVDPSTTDADVATIWVQAAATPTISNIETLNLNFGLSAGTLVASSINGAKVINIGTAEAGSSSASISSVLSGNTFSVDPSITSLTLATSSATSNTEAATVKLNGTVGTAGLTLNTSATGAAAANDVDVLTLNSTTAANTVTLGTAGASFAVTGESIIVTGDKSLTIRSAVTGSTGLNGATVTNQLTGGATLTVALTGGLDTATQDLSKVAATNFTISGITATAASTVTVPTNSTVKLTADFGTIASEILATGTTNGTLTLNPTVSQTLAFNVNSAALVNLNVTDSVTLGGLTLGNATGLSDAKLAIASTDSTKTLTLTTANAKEIDATGLTSKLVLNGQGAAVTKITGGSNNDTIVLANQALTVIGGAGDDAITANAVTGGLAISISGGDGVDTITLGVASTASVYDGGAGNDIFNQTAANRLVGNFIGGAGTDTIVFAAGANSVSGNTFTLSGIDVLDISAVGNTVTFKGSQLTGQTLNFLAAGGNDAVAIGVDTAGTAQSIDLSNINHNITTVALTLTGSSVTDVLKGTRAADVIVTNGGADTVSGSGGNDIFNVASSIYDTGANIVTITDANAGDVIATANVGTETWNATKLDVSAATTLVAALNTAAAGAGNTNAIHSWFQFGGDTYIVEDAGAGATIAAATDVVVKLTGLVDLAGVTFTQSAGAASTFTFV
jgi:S-layer protein